MLSLVVNPSYSGSAGVKILSALRQSMNEALQAENWLELQHLDRTCSAVVARVLATSDRDYEGLQLELTVLKAIYWQALSECKTRLGGPDAMKLLK